MPEVRFTVHLTPRGGSDRVNGVREDGVLLVRVAAPPADGAANAALVGLLAREVAAPRTSVRLVRGATNRRKTILIEGLAAATLEARWPGLAVTPPGRRRR